jgi:hypothetical protein
VEPEVASFLVELLAEAEAAQDRLDFAKSLPRTTSARSKTEPMPIETPPASRRTRRPRTAE